MRVPYGRTQVCFLYGNFSQSSDARPFRSHITLPPRNVSSHVSNRLPALLAPAESTKPNDPRSSLSTAMSASDPTSRLPRVGRLISFAGFQVDIRTTSASDDPRFNSLDIVFVKSIMPAFMLLMWRSVETESG